MLTGAFLVFVAVAVVCYGVQGSLQTMFARRYDAFTTAIFRNFSLVFAMAPILLFVPTTDIWKVGQHAGVLVLACSTGAASLLLSLTASKYLPIGVGTAIRQMVQVSFALMLGVLFLREWLTPGQFILLSMIVLVGVVLALSRVDFPHLNPRMVWHGIRLTVVSGFMLAASFFFFSILAREVHPFAASYFWEAGIAIFALMYCLWFWYMGKTSLKIPPHAALNIALVALLTIPATVSFAFALAQGPYAIAQGLLTMTTLVSLVMGWVLYREHLSRWQIALIFVAVSLMFLMKVA
jgi:drug/metabolite transporter (DMT)-like permease